jgi:AhpD family alkylhydroperoxidase
LRWIKEKAPARAWLDLTERKAGLVRPRKAPARAWKGRTMKNWPQMTKDLSALLRELRGGTPEVMKVFAGMAQTATAAKALDSKTKELIALAIAVAIRCDDCIAFHVKAAMQHGASREEIMETLGMAIYMGAGPSVMYATHALEAFTQFEAAAKPAESMLAPA